MVHGDPIRLRTALTAILAGLRRELVATDRLIVLVRTCEIDGRPSVRITVGDADWIDRLSSASPTDLATFDEWRGGNGLSLPLARRVIEAHHGRVWAPAQGPRSAAVVVLPSA